MISTIDTRESAQAIQEVFYGKAKTRQKQLPYGWPNTLVLCGKVVSVIYASDKWYYDGDQREYMHIAEAPQKILARPGFVRLHEDNMRALELVGKPVELVEPMPQHFAKLAPCMGLRVDFYTTIKNRKPACRGDQGLREVDTPGCFLGGAEHPVTGRPFLLVYHPTRGVQCIITGTQLDIEKDGITG